MARLLLQDYESVQSQNPQPVVTPAAPSAPPAESPQPAPVSTQNPYEKLAAPAKQAFRSNYPDFGKELGSAFGVQWPDDQTWDKMSFTDKTNTVVPALFEGGIKLVLGFPKAIAQALPNFVVQGAKPIQVFEESMLAGHGLSKSLREMTNLDTLSKMENAQIPFLSTLPWVGENIFSPKGSYFGPASQTKNEVSYIARQAGVPSVLSDFIGKIAGTGSVVTQALGDVAITASMAETMTNALKPRAQFDMTKPVDPIPYVERTIGGKKVYTAGEANSPSQYYSLSKTFAKEKWGGTTDNTFWKVAPTFEGGVELSVVKHVDAQPGSYVKINGAQIPVVQGKFGPEIKLHSENLKGPAQNLPAEIPPTRVTGTPVKMTPVTESEIESLMKSNLSPQEFKKYQTATTDINRATEALDTEANVLFNQGFVLGNNGKWVKPVSIPEEPFALKSPEGAPPTTADLVQNQLDELSRMEQHLAETEILIKENPVLGLKQYEAKSGDFKGTLPEALGLSLEEIKKSRSYGKIRSADTIKFIQQGDQIAAELGMTPDEATIKYEELKQQLSDVRAAKTDLKTKQAGLAEELKKAKTPDERAQIEAEYFKGSVPSFGSPNVSVSKAQIPTTPIKGFENKLVGQKEIDNLNNISSALKIPSGATEMIVRNMTGKSVASDLTLGEYTKVAQELSNFQNPYIPKNEVPTVARWIEPQRHWMSNFEEKTGQPIWSKIGKPLFEAEALQKVKIYNAEHWIHQIMGDYGGGENGRILRAYRLGDTGAITNNPNLNPAQKADLIKINDQITEYFTKIAADTNINLAEFENNPSAYVPNLADLGGKFTQYKSNEMVKGPKPVKLETGESVPGSSFFAKQKKEGNLNIPVDNIWQLMDIYARAGYKAKYFDNIKSEFQNLLPSLDPKIAESVNSTIQEVLGYGSQLDKFANESFKKIFDKIPGVNLPQDIFRRFMNFNSSMIYANVLNQPATWFRQLLSYPTIGYANIGSEFMASTIKDFVLNPKKYMDKARQKGFLLDMGSISELEFRKDVTLPEKGVGVYTQFNSMPNSMADNVTRALLAEQADKIFNNYMGLFQQKKITWNQAMKGMKIDGMSVPDQNIIIGRINSGDIAGANNAYIRNMIDDTFWPYQKGSSGRVTYGTLGKTGSMLLKWPLEYASTIKSWISRGQWDKIIRLYASSAAINRTFRDTFGWDFSSSMLLGPVLGLGLPPIQKMAAATIGAFQALLNADTQALSDNKDELVTTLKNVYRPLGLEGQNVQAFFKSWNQGPNADGKYMLYSRAGNPQYYADFITIWDSLFGFPSSEKVDRQNFISKEKALNFLGDKAKSDARKEIFKLMREGKADELNSLVQKLQENKIDIGQITSKDLQNSMVPVDQNMFKLLSPEARMLLFPEFMRLNQ